MKLSKKQKKFIKQNHDKLSVKLLAKKTKLDEETIISYLKKIGKDLDVSEKKILWKKLDINSFSDLKKFIIANIPFIVLLIILCTGVYLNSIKGEFVSDDLPGYVNSPVIKDLQKTLVSSDVRLQTIVYSLVWQVFELNPTPLHVISLLFHITNTILLFVLVYMVFDKNVSVISSLLFAVHPVNTEAVNWISGSAYLTNALIILSSLIFYTLYKRTKVKTHLVISSLIFILGAFLIRHQWFVVAPIIFILFDYFVLEDKFDIKRHMPLIPFIAGAGIYTIIDLLPKLTNRVYYVQNLSHNIERTLPLSTTLPYTTYMTIRLLVYPIGLTFYHEGEDLGPNFFKIAMIFTILLVPGIIYLWRKNKPAAGLTLIIFATMIPSYSPVQVAWYMAERYLYLGSAFFCILVGMLFIKLEKELDIKNLAMGTVVVLVLLYSIRTVMRNTDWRTPKKLWHATEKVAVDSPRVYNNLGDVYSQEGNYAKSISYFQRSIQANPRYAEAVHNLGRAYMLAGDLDNAEITLKRAIELKPGQYQSIYLLGVVSHQRGNNELAKEYFVKAFQINPNDPEVISALNFLQQEYGL